MSHFEGGMKLIDIKATTRYPIVSAYEFEFLKTEEVILNRLDNCTLYIIAQRPFTYFDNLRRGPHSLHFDICDDINPPLSCTFNLAKNGIAADGETVDLEIGWYSANPTKEEPYNGVAAFRIYRLSGEFVVWYTPQKFIYEVLANNLEASISGNVVPFIEYAVHYIGQAFSQKVWKRLTGHEKLQKILTVENPMSNRSARTPFEIALIMLEIVGYDETNVFPIYDFLIPEGVTPIEFPVHTDQDLLNLQKPLLATNASQLTAEAEALMIHQFKPPHNDILFENYPNIAAGTRSVGYTSAHLTIERLPAILRTENFLQPAIVSPPR